MVPHIMALLTHQDLADALPDMRTTQRLRGLEAEVTVYRDSLGIPHARARTRHDAFFAQGFFCAQDRLWQMDWDRRRAYGRSAEWLGPEAVEQDAFLRRMALEASALADYEAVGQGTRAMLDAYAAGVNAFIETSNRLPAEYRLLDDAPERWQPWDGLAIFKVRHLFMGTFEFKWWRARLLHSLGPERTASLFPVHEPGGLLIIPTGAEFEGVSGAAAAPMQASAAAPIGVALDSDPPDAGSNSWALSASRTSTGGPLLAGDSHRAPDTPNVYYQNRIACPDFDAVGLSFAGLPGFHHFGHNGRVAWCVTHTAADYQDLFIERFGPDAPARYEYEGEWYPADVRRETLRARGAADTEIEVVRTHHGPVVFGEPRSGYAMSLRYTATAEPGRWADCILAMLTAADADEFEAAQRDWVDPCNNLLCTDVRGNISYLMRGRLPVRASANAWAPVPGWTGEHEWRGMVPFEDVPRMRNPEAGYIVTANNRVMGASYPHYITVDYTPDLRARALNERLAPLTNADANDMEKLHATRGSLLARQAAPLFLTCDAKDEAEAEALRLLADWDMQMDRDAVAPTVYSAATTELLRIVSVRLIGESLTEEALDGTGRGAGAMVRTLRHTMGRAIAANDASLLGGATWREVAQEAWHHAIVRLRTMLGDDPSAWAWGVLHRTKHEHPLSVAFPELAGLLNPPQSPVNGDGETPLQGAYVAGDPFTARSVSVARYVYDPTDWSNSRWVVPLGSSGHPGSPHYADQLETWASVRTYPMRYDWSDVEADAESVQRLHPDHASP